MAQQAGARQRRTIARVAIILFTPLFLLLHGSVILLAGSMAGHASLSLLMLPPLMAGIACLFRAVQGDEAEGWPAFAMSLFCWAGGMAATMAGTLYFQTDGQAAVAMLLFILYGVPLIFTLASPGGDIWPVRLVDAMLALVLGMLFFAHTFAFATLTGATEIGTVNLRMMFDIENAFIAIFALTRFLAEDDRQRRAFFGQLTLFAWVYLLTAAYINHVEVDTAYGALADLVIDIPFLLLTMVVLWNPGVPGGVPSARFARLVRVGSPLMLPACLLTVSALLVPLHSVLAVCGFVAAMAGYGLRSILVQMRVLNERERLEHLSSIDGLTGLPNRRHFDQMLHRECARAQRDGGALALLMIDIDHFKCLNDGLGHQVGDARLRQVGAALAGCARRGTDVVARYGGEEFAAILPGLGGAEALAVAEHMCGTVRALALKSPAPSGRVTVSIGLACHIRGEHDDGGALVARADAALYGAKHAGRDRVMCDGEDGPGDSQAIDWQI